MKTSYLVVLLLASFAVAKDKPTMPAFSDSQAKEGLKIQRDAIIAYSNAQPYKIAADQAQAKYQQWREKMLKEIGCIEPSWKFNDQSFECEAVPQPVKADEKQPVPSTPK